MLKITRWKLVCILLFLIVAVLVGLSFFSMRPPNEARLIQNFQVHRASYERLRDMFLEDKQLKSVYVDSGVGTTDSPLVRKPSEANFSLSRYNEYVRLLREANSAAAFRGEVADPWLVCISAWRAGWAGYSRHVWVCSAQRPRNQVASLATYYADPNGPRNVYRHIGGDWYLRADW